MNRIKLLLIIWWLKLTRKLKRESNLLSIKKNGSGINDVLVILPEGQENSRVARYFLKSIQNSKMPGLNFLMDIRLFLTFNGTLPETVQTYSVNDEISWMNLPKKEFVTRLLDKRYDAVVDMHPTFNLATAYLTFLSNAPLRIGFSGDYSEHFFNIEIERKDSDFIEKAYQWIQRLLDL